MDDRDEPAAPLVTVRGGPAEHVPDPRAGAALRGLGLLLAVAAVVLAVVQVAAGRSGRFVVLLTPDCNLLGERSRLAFRALLLVQVEQDGDGLQLVLDIGSDRAVARVVDGLCGRR